MALPRSLTVSDLYAMPESGRGERYELIDGALVVNPAPVSRHQTVSSNLGFHLSVHVRANRPGWVRNNSGVYIDERTYVIPDIVFIARERQNIIGSTNIEAAPDLVCEILSPSSRRSDVLTKRSLYARIGVREYWIVDPDAQSVTVLALESGSYVEVAPGNPGEISSRVLPNLRLSLNEVFEDVDVADVNDAVERVEQQD